MNRLFTAAIIRRREPSLIATSFTMDLKNYFSGNPLNRWSINRKNEEFLAKTRSLPSTRYILINHEGKALYRRNMLENGKRETRISYLSYDQVNLLFSDDSNEDKVIYLGEYQETRKFKVKNKIEIKFSLLDYYALGLTTKLNEDKSNALALQTEKDEFRDSRPAAFEVGVSEQSSEAAILSQALALCDWHRRNRFCPACGQPNYLAEAGYRLVCKNAQCLVNSAKGAVHNFQYPRTDLVIITLVLDASEKYCALGRQKRFPAGTYSCIAGFMEPGESIKDACKREVKEEIGLDLDSVTIIDDQPWPFPSSLMLGCVSKVAQTITERDQGQPDSELVCVDGELEDARWFSLEQVKTALSNAALVNPFDLPKFANSNNSSESSKKANLSVEEMRKLPLAVPPAYAIANRLMNYWVKNQRL